MVKHFKCYMVGMAVIGLILPSGSWGQTAKAKKAAPVGAVEIEEITVTAQKREENIQEIPVSVTALTGTTLEERGVVELTDLMASVPNLRTELSSAGNSSFFAAMRGTANLNNALSQSSTVGLHLDGVYISKSQGAAMDLEDLDRVEVLRGPQGTLFGRNTTGGAINLVTKKPTEERSITASTQVGNYDAFKGRVTLNVPLVGKNGVFHSDSLGTLSLRENAVYRSHEPYVDNKSPTNVRESGTAGFNNVNRVFSMTALRWQPTKAVTVDYAFEYHRFRAAPPATQVSYILPGGPVDATITVPGFGTFPNPNSLVPYVRPQREDSIGLNEPYDNDRNLHRLTDSGNNRLHILTGAWDLGELRGLGNVTLKSISAYRTFTEDLNNDIDGSPTHVGDSILKDNINHWSQEVQVIGTAPRVHYVLGGYYYGEHTTEINNTMFLNGAVNQYNVNTGTVSAYAPFGQVTYTPPILSDKLSITGGLRYTQEHAHMRKNFRCINITAVVGGRVVNMCNQIRGLEDFNISAAKSFGAHGTAIPGLSPMANVAYQWTDNAMTYLKVSRGFQSGNINSQASDPRFFEPFDPEKLWAYEGGVKSQWLDNRLRFNLSGFLSKYSDQVISVARFSPVSGSQVRNENAGESEFWGFELEAVALPLRGVEATLNYAYLNTKYLTWAAQKYNADGTAVFDANGNPVLENVANQRDTPLAPDHTISVGLTYTAPPTTAGVFSAHVDAYWQEDTVNHPVRPQPDREGNYAVVNGRVQFVDIPLQKGSLDIAVYGRNLFDRQYRSFGFDLGALGWAVNTFGDPRTFGLQLTYNFTAS